jgi:hypothetical protein
VGSGFKSGGRVCGYRTRKTGIYCPRLNVSCLTDGEVFLWCPFSLFVAVHGGTAFLHDDQDANGFSVFLSMGLTKKKLAYPQVVKSHSSLTYIGTSVLSGLVTSQGTRIFITCR